MSAVCVVPPIVKIQKKKMDLMSYYTDMSGNNLQYLVNGNHVEPEVLTDVRAIMKKKLEQEEREKRERDILAELRDEIEDSDADFDEKQSRRMTRKSLFTIQDEVFKTGYLGERSDAYSESKFSKNPLERNIQMAEKYTMDGSPSYDTLIMKSGIQEAAGLAARTKMGRKQARSVMSDMFDVGVYNMHNAAPILTSKRNNQSLLRVDENIPQHIDPDDFMDAMFRR